MRRTTHCGVRLDIPNLYPIEVNFRFDGRCYGQLFDSGLANVELLNKSGSYVFWLFQQLILDNPSPWESREAFCGPRALDDFDLEARKRLGEGHLKDSKSFFEKGNIPNRVREHEHASVAVLNIARMHDRMKQEL